MRPEEQRLVDDCKVVVRTLLEVDGEVPEWVSMTALVTPRSEYLCGHSIPRVVCPEHMDGSVAS